MGAVLCGGLSTRMGRDKALVPYLGVPMARRVADALVAGGCATVVAVGGDDAGLSALGLAPIPDLHPAEGPLGAVITALGGHDHAEAVLVVGCDMPLLDGAAVGSLLSALREHPEADVAMGFTDRRQPLFAAWRPSCLPELRRVFGAGERAIHRAVRELHCVDVAVPPESVRNVNTVDDLND